MPRVATAIAVAAWGTAVLAVVLTLAARPPVDEDLWFFAVDVTVACVYGTVAAVILAPAPAPRALDPRASRRSAAACPRSASPGARTRSTTPACRPSTPVGALQGLAWVPGTLALFLVVPWLVRDHPLGRAVWGVVAGTVLIVALVVCQVARGRRGLHAARDGRRRPRPGRRGRGRATPPPRPGRPSATASAGWPSAPPCWPCPFVPLALPVGPGHAARVAHPGAAPGVAGGLPGRGARRRAPRPDVGAAARGQPHRARRPDDGHPRDRPTSWSPGCVTRVVPGSGSAQLVGAGRRRRGRPARPAVARAPGAPPRARRRRATPDHVVRRLGSHLSLEGSADDAAAAASPRTSARRCGWSRSASSCRATTTSSGGCRPARPVAVPLRHRGEEVGDAASSPCPGASRSARPGSARSATWPTSSRPPWR